MIQIYKANNTDYDHNGDAVLRPILCEVELNLNGVWLLELQYPIDADGIFKLITNGAVICAPTPIGEKQLFRIYNVIKTDTDVTASARPVFMDSAGDAFLIDTRPTAKNGQEALDIMTDGTKYRGQSDISKVATAYYIRKNLIESIAGGDENSFLNIWGGEVLYDNNKIIINERVGGDYGVKATFGRNLAGIEEEIDTDRVLTRIVPIAFNGHTLEKLSPFVDSPLIDKYPIVYTQVVKFEDVKLAADAQEDEQSFETLELLQAELVRRSNIMFTAGCDKPTCQYKVDIVNLEDTEEYKDYKILEKIGLGDTIHCKHKRLGIETEQRVISIKYDCILKRNIEETLGDAQADYFDDLTATYERVNDVINPKNGHLIAEKVSGILDGMNTQLRYQKDVAKRQDVRAILFEDMDTTSPLYGALSIGTQGFQIANRRTEDGKDWDWSTAATANGLIADSIISGMLTDKAGRNFWNLDTGEMSVSSAGFTVDGETVEDIAKSEADKARSITISLTNDYQLITTDHAGDGGDFSDCNTRIFVQMGQLDVTTSARYTITPSDNVTGAWDNTRKLYQVTSMTEDSGYVDITVQYAQLSATKKFEIVKQKGGTPGRTYMLAPSTTIAKLKMDGYVSPESVTFNSYYRDGSAATRIAYAGRFVVEVTEDDVTYKKVYESTVNETETTLQLMPGLATGANDEIVTAGSDVLITIASSIIGARCTLYAAGGKTQKLDVQSVPVVFDFENMTSEDMFNLLTDNGKVQGMYMKDNQLYINASYIQAGEFRTDMIVDGVNKASDYIRLIEDGMYSIRADGSAMTSLNGDGLLLHDYEKNEAGRQKLIGGLHTRMIGFEEKSFLIDLHEADFLDFVYNTQESEFMTALRFYKNTKVVPKIGWYFFTDACMNSYKHYFGPDYKNYLQNLDGSACIATENTFMVAYPSGGGYYGIMAFSKDGMTAYKNLNMNGWNITNQSDERLKNNIYPTNIGALDVIKEIELFEYDWIETGKHDSIGYVADQLETVCEDFVIEDADGIKGTIDHEIIKYLVKGMQELTVRVEELEGKNVALKSKLSRMQKKKWQPTEYTDAEKETFVEKLVIERAKQAEEPRKEYIPAEGEWNNGTDTKTS